MTTFQGSANFNGKGIASHQWVSTPFLSLVINAFAYGFAGEPAANLTNKTIGQAFSYANKTIGKINDISYSSGSGYDHAPFIIFDESDIAAAGIYDYQLAIVGSTGSFTVGELINQANNPNLGNNTSGPLGIVKENSNTSILFLQNLSYTNQFIPTTNNSTYIIGAQSRVTANIVTVNYDPVGSPSIMGMNANVILSYNISNGAIANCVIIDSGYGFINGQAVQFANNGTGIAILKNQGFHQGYYNTEGGFLSDDKKLFDGVFYQNYSYQIRSPILFDKYEALVKQLAHPAGMALFGEFKYTNNSGELKSINPGSIVVRSGINYGSGTLSVTAVQEIQAVAILSGSSSILTSTKGKIYSTAILSGSSLNSTDGKIT